MNQRSPAGSHLTHATRSITDPSCASTGQTWDVFDLTAAKWHYSRPQMERTEVCCFRLCVCFLEATLSGMGRGGYLHCLGFLMEHLLHIFCQPLHQLQSVNLLHSHRSLELLVLLQKNKLKIPISLAGFAFWTTDSYCREILLNS